MKQAMERGHWVFFQNCHLAPSWMPTLERLIEHIDPNKVRMYVRILYNLIILYKCVLHDLNLYCSLCNSVIPLYVHVYVILF